MLDETFDETIRDLLGASKRTCDEAWNRYIQNHIEPDRVIELGFGLVEPNNRERAHLASCTKCSNRLSEFLSTFCTSDKQVVDPPATCYAPEQQELWSSLSEETTDDDHQERLAVLPVTVTVPSLLRDNLQLHGPVLFPNDEVAFISWQFGRLLQPDIDSDDVISIVNLVGNKAAELVHATIQSKRIVIVCFGRAMHLCGVRIAANLREHGLRDPHVILAHDYYSPTLVCDPKEVARAEVVVLVDVVRTGDLLKRTVAACMYFRPRRLFAIAVIDQSDGLQLDFQYLSIWKEFKEERIALGDLHTRGKFSNRDALKRFDANDECASVDFRNFSVPRPAARAAEHAPAVDEGLLECIHETGAFKRDYRIGRKLYPYVVNVLDLLKTPTSRDFVVRKVKEVLSDISNRRTCLVYHAGRSRRAGKVAKLLGMHLGLPVSSIGTREPSFSLSDSQFRFLACYDNVVIVDAAIRTGETIAAVTRAIDDKWLRKHTRFIALGILDALSQRSRDDLAAELELEIRTLFTLPLAPPTEQVRHWANSQKAVIKQHLVDSGKFESVRTVLGKYCDRRPAKRSAVNPPESVKETEHLVNKVSKEARASDYAFTSVSEACRINQPSLIRHIPINEAVRDHRVQSLLVGVLYNSMKPSFKESAVFALAAAGNYDWMNLDWLKCNRAFLGSKSECWKSVAVVECQMKLEMRDVELSNFRQALLEYRKLGGSGKDLKARRRHAQIRLFEEKTLICQSTESSDRILARVDALIQVAEGAIDGDVPS